MAKACQQLVQNLGDAAKDVKADTASDFWAAAVAKVHSGVGFAPATAQLSAIGFFDGSETGGTFQIPACVLLIVKGAVDYRHEGLKPN